MCSKQILWFKYSTRDTIREKKKEVKTEEKPISCFVRRLGRFTEAHTLCLFPQVASAQSFMISDK